MQKNECDLLEAWSKYHTKITRPANITIVDNGSNEQKTLKILELLAKKGFNIVSKENPEEFEKKGAIIEELIKKNHKPNCVSIPLDCDEFLTLETQKGIECKAKNIKKYLHGCASGKIFKVKRRLNNSPFSHHEFMPMPAERPTKLFFTTTDFRNLDIGFHSCSSSHRTSESEISLVHLHFGSHRSLIEKSKEKLKSRVDINSAEKLTNYSGKGHHLIPYLILTKNELSHKIINENIFVRCKNFSERIKKYKIKHPFEPWETKEIHDIYKLRKFENPNS